MRSLLWQLPCASSVWEVEYHRKQEQSPHKEVIALHEYSIPNESLRTISHPEASPIGVVEHQAMCSTWLAKPFLYLKGVKRGISGTTQQDVCG